MNEQILFSPPTDRMREAAERELDGLSGVSGFTLGNSILGRPIRGWRIGHGRSEILYVATHHALESVCASILYAFIDRLAADDSPYAKTLRAAFTLTVIPCLNPDGVALRYGEALDNPLHSRQMRMSGGSFARWQANARGVDLNHNYSQGFYEYKRIEAERGIVPGPTLYSGEYPESEPETMALASLVRVLSPSLVLSLHTQGEEIFYYPEEPRCRRLADRASALCGYSVSAAEGTACYGGLCDYTGAMGIPSLTVEVGRGKNPLPDDSAKGLFCRIHPLLRLLPSLL